jgi:hypothetical protein
VKRSTLANRIRELVRGAEATAPHAARALALWGGELLTRRKRGGDQLALSAVDAISQCTLSHPFSELVGDARQDQLEEDELTDLYSEVISSIPLKSQHYSRCRLQEFHAWLARQVPMEDPDWTEIPGAPKFVNASQASLPRLNICRHLNTCRVQDKDCGAQGLSFCYSLIGLVFEARKHSAFCEANGFGRELPYLRIRHNRLKNLKTERTTSRLVPLVASLTVRENKLIEQSIAQLEAHVGVMLMQRSLVMS